MPFRLVLACLLSWLAIPTRASADDANVPPEPAVENPATQAQGPDDASQPTQPGEPGVVSEPPAPAEAKEKKPRRSVEFGGRIFVRDTLRRAPDGDPNGAGWTNDLDLDSARVGLEYKDRKLDLELELELELADGDAEIRDGYIRWDATRQLRLQLGHFKAPVGAITLASRWSLPTLERGLLNDYEFITANTSEPDVLPVGGREIGVMLTWRGRDIALRPEVSLAIMRGRVHEQLIGANQIPLGISDGFTEDVYARVEVSPIPDVQVGVSAGWITMLELAGERDSFRNGGLISLDAVVELGPMRFWLEGFLGSNPIHLDIVQNSAEGRFMALRAIASGRLDLPSGPLAYLELYASAQYLDVSDDLDDDTGNEQSAGLVVAFHKSWRLQMGYRHQSLDNRLRGTGSRFMLQAGAVF